MYKLSVYAEGDLVQNTLKTSLIYTKNMEKKKKKNQNTKFITRKIKLKIHYNKSGKKYHQKIDMKQLTRNRHEKSKLNTKIQTGKNQKPPD